ncbi:MAG: hypothetical protein AAF581_00200 [Planctomycetota bacterium]
MVPSDDTGSEGPTKEELQQAMKAFKKRLKLHRLDDESRLGHGAMTKGGQSGIVGIRCPEQFPQEIWDALVEKGKIEYLGNGLYGRVVQ